MCCSMFKYNTCFYREARTFSCLHGCNTFYTADFYDDCCNTSAQLGSIDPFCRKIQNPPDRQKGPDDCSDLRAPSKPSWRPQITNTWPIRLRWEIPDRIKNTKYRNTQIQIQLAQHLIGTITFLPSVQRISTDLRFSTFLMRLEKEILRWQWFFEEIIDDNLNKWIKIIIDDKVK